MLEVLIGESKVNGPNALMPGPKCLHHLQTYLLLKYLFPGWFSSFSADSGAFLPLTQKADKQTKMEVITNRTFKHESDVLCQDSGWKT